jgi:hypothetical protein
MPRALWRSLGGGAVSYERGTPVGEPLLSEMKQLQGFQGLSPERQGQNLVWTVWCVPYSLGARDTYLRLQGYLAHQKTPTPLGPP